MATARWEIMSRSGPEDSLQAVQLPTNSSAQLTAGNDWAVRRAATTTARLDYTDEQEAQRFVDLLTSNGAEARVLRDLATSRHVCTQPAFALELCKKTFREHQAKQCSPAYLEMLKCNVKMTRAVDSLCRPSFQSLSTCLASNSSNASKCVDQIKAFDRCTEEF